MRVPSRARHDGRRWGCALVLALGLLCAAWPPGRAEAEADPAAALADTVAALAALGDRSTGTPGHGRAADYLRTTLEQLFPGAVTTQGFTVPVIRHGAAALSVPGRPAELPLRALAGNALTPPAVAPPGMTGPLVYVGSGALPDMNGRPVEGAILLVELDSGDAWISAADLGAGAIIYVDRGQSPRTLFEDKFEISPRDSRASGRRPKTSRPTSGTSPRRRAVWWPTRPASGRRPPGRTSAPKTSFA